LFDPKSSIPSNLFECGGNLRYVTPYVDRLISYNPGLEDGIDEFISFFMDILSLALSNRSEREEVPDWVFDHDDYRMKTELLVASVLFIGILDRKACPFGSDYVFDSDDHDVPDTEYPEVVLFHTLLSDIPGNPHRRNIEYDHPGLPYLLQDLFIVLIDRCSDSSWDPHMFRSYVLNSFGIRNSQVIMPYLLPCYLVNKDYN